MKRTKVWACENCTEIATDENAAAAHRATGHSMVARRVLGTVEALIADVNVTPWITAAESIDEAEQERRGERALASRER